jgi:phage shock protein C
MDNTTENLKLYRSRRQKTIAGVCGGFAEYTGMDVTMVRVFWVLAVLFNGAGVMAYLVCLILMRENPELSADATAPTIRPHHTELVIGLAFIIIGAAILLYNTTGQDWWLPWHWHHILHTHVREVWPILLIALGAWVLIRSYHTPKSESSAESIARSDKFIRSKSERMIGGVCGGLAEYWHVDATLVRIVWVLTSLFVNFLAGGLLYVLILVLVPEDSKQHGPSVQP